MLRGMSAPTVPCPSCGQPVPGAFCSACGERRFAAEELTVRAQVGQAFTGLFSVDGRLGRSLRALVSQPGFLAVEYCRGARVRYMRPVQLLLVASLVYFVAQPWTGFNTFRATYDLQVERQVYSGHLAQFMRGALPAEPAARAEFIARFDAAAGNLARSLVFSLVPVTALVMHLLGRRRGRGFVEHLVLATHYVSFQLLVLYVGVLGAIGGLQRLRWIDYDEDLAGIGLTLASGLWVVPAWRRFHGVGWGGAVLAGGLVALANLPIVLEYRYLLFWLSYLAA